MEIDFGHFDYVRWSKEFFEDENGVDVRDQPDKTITDSSKDLEENALRMQQALARLGWYIAFGRLEPQSIISWGCNLATAAREDVEIKLVAFAKTHAITIQNDLELVWPSRAPIIRDAFIAHFQGIYSLSIPTMLAQADGICEEMLGVQMYAKQHKDRTLPRTNTALANTLASITSGGNQISVSPVNRIRISSLRMLYALSQNTADRDRMKSKGEEISLLNRHGVLHGLDIDYGNESNSLRCVLLLDFLRDVRAVLDSLKNYAGFVENIINRCATERLAIPTAGNPI